MKPVLVITDNKQLFAHLRKCTEEIEGATFTYRCSDLTNRGFKQAIESIPAIDIRNGQGEFVDEFELIISLHCKQLFPADLVNRVRCVNIHPGYNPFNRGWYPQVFSILNDEPLGVTIHEMDDKLDNGRIIIQERVPIYSYDTSLSAYERVVSKEKELISSHLQEIVDGSYRTTPPCDEGTLNTKTDFSNLCKLDLREVTTLGKAIDHLRALTHGSFKNAYFHDSDGKKVYVSVTLTPEIGATQKSSE